MPLSHLLASPWKQGIACGGTTTALAAPLLGFFGGLGRCWAPSKFNWTFAGVGALLGLFAGIGAYFARSQLNAEVLALMQQSTVAETETIEDAQEAMSDPEEALMPGTGRTFTNAVLAKMLTERDRAQELALAAKAKALHLAGLA